MAGPTIFIGSSSEARGITERVADGLAASHCVDVLPWYEAFPPGFTALEELAKRLDEVDFAAFLLLPDDQVRMRDRTGDAPRDNVVFELGLFMGKLNRDRAFALVDTRFDRGDLELFSDLKGVTYIPFDIEHVEGAVGTLVARISELGPIVRAPQGTHVVERGSRGGNVHDTISAAVEIAESGDVILVRPGIYTDPLVIEKPLEIIGVGGTGDNDRAVIRTEGETAITYAAGGGQARLAAVRIESSGEGRCAVDVRDGSLMVRSCAITGRGPIEACVRVAGSARAMIDNNRIVDSEGVGILVCEAGEASITDNLVSGHGHSCIEARDGVQPRIVSNRIAEGRSGGVWLHGHAGGEIIRNDIWGHHMAAVTVTERAHPVIEGNRVHHGLDAGIHVSDGSSPRIKENDIYANEGTGIEIGPEGDPVISNNRVYGGLGGGIALQERARGRLDDNFIGGNKRAGVAFAPGSHVRRFSRNHVVDGLAEGVHDAAGVDCAGNQVERNRGGDCKRPEDV